MAEPMSDAFIQGEIRLVERFGDSCQYTEDQILARLREILRLRAEVALLKVLGAKADEVVCAALKANHEQKSEIAALKAGMAQVLGVMRKSRGVVGWHLNGDEAPWDELFNDEEWKKAKEVANG